MADTRISAAPGKASMRFAFANVAGSDIDSLTVPAEIHRLKQGFDLSSSVDVIHEDTGPIGPTMGPLVTAAARLSHRSPQEWCK
jgi:hypothetical protein